jgi:hypoxanthine phosphoribosyltransferase
VGEPAVDAPREILTWDEFGRAGRELAQTVVDSGFVPDVVLAIARGGLPVAGSIAYALPTKNCFVINVEYYTGIGETRELPVILPPYVDARDLSGMNVLLVDDVADSGHTLKLVQEEMRPQVAELRTAVLYQKPRSIVQAEYAWRTTDRWIVFPWSADEPILAGVRDA